MSTTTFRILDHVNSDIIAKIKTKQSRELMMYLHNKYGHNAVDQSELMLDLNLHQKDTVVFSEIPTGPISRTYEFYRKNSRCGWFEAGLIEIVKTSKASAEKQRVSDLEARIEYLENLCIENNVEFDVA